MHQIRNKRERTRNKPTKSVILTFPLQPKISFPFLEKAAGEIIFEEEFFLIDNPTNLSLTTTSVLAWSARDLSAEPGEGSRSLSPLRRPYH
jgi:hypothetical protein